jgi:Family of unknown function (DUF6600)
MRRLALAVLALVLAFAAPALAQESPPGLVGRVSYVSGNLAFHTTGESAWSAALVNYPVAAGGSFWADPQSRAEFRIGPQTIDLAGGAAVDVVRLDEQMMELGLPQGRINLHLRSLGPGTTAQIDLPRGGVWLLQPGIYDIAAGSPDEPTRIAVFAGSARFVGGGIDRTIPEGSALVVAGTTVLNGHLEPARPDEFAEWCRSRDYRENRLAAPYYVSPDMTGYAELDEYGSWGEAPQYGRIWYPTSVPADWAPYRDGHWVWVAPWGWTWVDALPWGFAPFHYGRWAHVGGRWGWIPGRFVPHPVYAPALVAFIGRPGVGIRIAGAPGPAVGWFPLGPNEVYWPSYSHDPRYIRSINITNVSVTRITRITNVIGSRRGAAPPPEIARQRFVNRTAATVVPVKAFASAARVNPKTALHVAPHALRRAAVSVRPPHVAPTAARIKPAHPPAAPPLRPATVRPPAAAPRPAPQVVHPPAAPTHVPPAAEHRPTPQAVHPAAPTHAPPAAEHRPTPQAVHPAAPTHAPPAAEHRPPPQVVRPSAPTHVPPAAEHRRAPQAVHPAAPTHAPPAAEHRPAPQVVHPTAPTHAPPAIEHRPAPTERHLRPPAAERVPPQALRRAPPANRAVHAASHPRPHPGVVTHRASRAVHAASHPRPHPAAVAHRASRAVHAAPHPRPHPAVVAHRAAPEKKKAERK